MRELSTPLDEQTVRELRAGELVLLSGLVVTARDAGHKLMVEQRPTFLDPFLAGGAIYHCGPVVRQDQGRYRFVAAGPTTSIREEPYEATVMEQYGVRAIIGKGGMGAKTLEACKRLGAVYLHAIGGCGTQIADAVKEVIDVFKLEEFGTPEAFWLCRLDRLPLVVTMDSHGFSIHDQVEQSSREKLARLLSNAVAY